MKKFISSLFYFIIPLVLLCFLFVLIDPFMIIGQNKGKAKITSKYDVAWNRDFQSTELFIKNIRKERYNSFIMGNSRSFYYNVNTWQKYVKGNFFHFNSSSESLYGIEKKIQFLKKNDIGIKNLFIVLDYDVLNKVNDSEGHLFIKHPIISGKSYLYFYTEMFQGFFPKATFAFLDLYLTGTPKAYMYKFGVSNNLLNIDLKTNQITNFVYDSIINNNLGDYYFSKKDIFYERNIPLNYYPQVILKKQKKILMDIKSTISNYDCNLKIVISPLYNQKKLNPNDVKFIERLFNPNNVYDFSGKNKFTEDYTNYYETSHYRPIVADEIMKIVYGQDF